MKNIYLHKKFIIFSLISFIFRGNHRNQYARDIDINML